VPRESFSGHLDLLLLAALESGPAHGYGVIDHMRRRSGGNFDYPEGTVYPALHRLEGAGFLRSRWSEDSPRRRRVYELTARGQKELASRRIQWERYAHSVAAVLGEAST
jgi:DNA-binding PadR family transcriptional regulator